MKTFRWDIRGQGKINIVLLHGWGINYNIWDAIINTLSSKFKCYIIDLPGFGKNINYPFMNIKKLTNMLISKLPKNSIWLGWSMGALIINYMNIKFEKNIHAIINICYSPCFIQKNDWVGIPINILQNFFNQIKHNYYKTISQFLKSQVPINKFLNNNFILNNIIKNLLIQPKPSIFTLEKYLNIIINIDLRKYLSKFTTPSLSLYGELDMLVQHRITKNINKLYPKNYSYIIKKSGHIPFISHPEATVQKMLLFIKNVIKN
ncbi:pimeloyl-[acyl-carrier protein] methyl ester esterase [Buchnera aphidicola (Nipponaphis monzeni)]|uniref:Pimeloyl-[acyl-carrier protein] methyl ester esterase n=1 Tax=Buchnera aphidicola (Nipponaphis monzeni) TaxID=2495405 RepID=A0A455TAR0_9GAMM|nr:alpha/beta fold hydrolase [Buchnera aphidicola]BBI01416.1 pimeloyl-[acyl-carrier protein] methyl ester esterase [Buchnera aphidicola (Nipponaphis monzeni)]